MAGRNATTPICQAAVAKLGQVGRLQSHIAGGKWSFGRDDTSVRRYTSKYGVAEAVWGRCLKRRDLQAIPASGEHPNLPFYFLQHIHVNIAQSPQHDTEPLHINLVALHQNDIDDYIRYKGRYIVPNTQPPRKNHGDFTHLIEKSVAVFVLLQSPRRGGSVSCWGDCVVRGSYLAMIICRLALFPC
jgi:hypothetical protein